MLDALYMTVTTVTTVGYGEIIPLDPRGRMFTIVLILLGVGTVLYLLSTVAELVLEGRLRDFLGRNAMRREIERLAGHTIVCGYGRLGRAVVAELRRSRAAFVVIEANAAVEPELEALGSPYVMGSALQDAVLEQAGVGHARALVLAMPSDPDNVFVTLAAREKNAHLRIHSRAESEVGARRLRLAGADQVVSAHQMGGLRIAASILRPSVVDFLAITDPDRQEEVDLEEVRVAAASPVAGQPIRSIEETYRRLRVVALRREGEAMTLVPDATTTVLPDDLLVAMGDRPSLYALAQAAQAPA